jgi:quinolinate synthase
MRCRSAGHAGHLHQLGGRPEGLLRRHGGIVCTSSNAGTIAEWAFARREKVLFFPDQHLGRWTGHKMGIPLDEMVVWDPDLELGGLTPEQIRKAKILLWKGHCSVHQMFQPVTSSAGASSTRRASSFRTRSAISRCA